MNTNNVLVVLAKSTGSAGFFDYADALRNKYFFPYDDIETEENETNPSQGKWRFVTKPESQWNRFGLFVCLSDKEALSVVNRSSKSFYKDGTRGAQAWAARLKKAKSLSEVEQNLQH